MVKLNEMLEDLVTNLSLSPRDLTVCFSTQISRQLQRLPIDRTVLLHNPLTKQISTSTCLPEPLPQTAHRAAESHMSHSPHKSFDQRLYPPP